MYILKGRFYHNIKKSNTNDELAKIICVCELGYLDEMSPEGFSEEIVL
jgi:hypothetical protein